ncbi:CDP-diacylglycerol--serine O-phosphatidyltransferase, partial [Mariprofundus ferrooxydans]|nr:CDP-diacylglycerol--serine O-phosphatidyltransferase [Mariprofundus ferrooxydans]
SWLGAFFLVACAAIRLARFNVKLDVQDKRYFQGLPTPGAALLIATAVLFHLDATIEPLPWLWFIFSTFLAWLMVSNVRFVSGKDLDLKKRQSSSVLLIMVVLVAFLAIDPYRVPFTIILAYCLHGPLMSLWQNRRLAEARKQRHLRRKARKNKSKDEDPS